MQFTRRLHHGIRSGEITSTIRIWQQPRVKVGGRYKVAEGEVQVESIMPIALSDITPEMMGKVVGAKGATNAFDQLHQRIYRDRR